MDTVALTPFGLALTIALASLAGCTAAGGSGSDLSVTPGNVVWVEAENVLDAPKDAGKVVEDVATASGGQELYGSIMDPPDRHVRYEFTVPRTIDDARLLIRFARLHWRESMTPAELQVRLEGPAGTVERTAEFGNTGGWGYKTSDWGLTRADLGNLPAGKYALTLATTEPMSGSNLDGFFICPSDFEIDATELASMLRLNVSSAGYVGYEAGSAAVDQNETDRLTVRWREFGPAAAKRPATAWLKGDWRAIELKRAADDEAASATEGPQALQFVLPELPDGAYTLHVVSEYPPADFTIELRLIGDLLAELPGRIAELERFAATLDELPGDAPQRWKPDFTHAIEYLKSGHDTLDSSAELAETSQWKAHLTQAEGGKPADVHAVTDNVLTTLGQYTATMRRLRAGENPLAKRTGPLRRALRSDATGDLKVYRMLVPSNYPKADKVPFVLFLHGGGGDENYWHNMEDGKILETLDRRGYLAVMPKWHRRSNAEHWQDDALQLIRRTREEFPKIDAGRMYVTGISMGGFGTYRIATAHPELWAAACSVSGTGDPEWADALEDVPLLILQGGADTVVPPAGAKKVARRLEELGHEVSLHIFPHRGHGYDPDEYLRLTLDWFDRFRKSATADE